MIPVPEAFPYTNSIDQAMEERDAASAALEPQDGLLRSLTYPERLRRYQIAVKRLNARC